MIKKIRILKEFYKDNKEFMDSMFKEIGIMFLLFLGCTIIPIASLILLIPPMVFIEYGIITSLIILILLIAMLTIVTPVTKHIFVALLKEIIITYNLFIIVLAIKGEYKGSKVKCITDKLEKNN